MPRPFKRSGILLAVGYVALLGFSVWQTRRVLPNEDAAMLYSYSENLADTGVISFFPGGPPAEGATDFLWMVILAGLYKAGVPTHAAAAAVGTIALIVAVELVVRQGTRMPPTLARVVLVGLVVASPFFVSHLAGFSTMPFGCALVGAMLGAVHRRPKQLMGWGAIACLIRPDGLVFVTGMLAAHAWDLHRAHLGSALRREVRPFVAVFLLPLATYWGWRWGYFGRFFPLPFVVKSTVYDVFAFVFSAASALTTLQVLLACMPLLAAAAFSDKNGRVWALRIGVVVIVPVVLFYSRMDLQNNFGDRLQFPLYFMSASLSVMYATSRLVTAAVVVSIATLATTTYDQAHYYWIRYRKDQSNILTLSRYLRDMPGVTLLTSEAGLLPYLSKSTTYDSWGLNTPAFAAHPIQPEDVVALRPDLIYLNDDVSMFESVTGAETGFPMRARWEHQTFNVFVGAKRAGDYQAYQVPLVTGARPVRLDTVLLRRGSPRYEVLQRALADVPGARACDSGGCTDIHVSAVASSTGGRSLTVIVEVDPRDVNGIGELHLQVAAFTPQGTVRKLEQTASITLPGSEPIGMTAFLPLEPGRYLLRIAVTAGKRSGSTYLVETVPEAGGVGFNTRPDRAPVNAPSFRATMPLTITQSMPSAS